MADETDPRLPSGRHASDAADRNAVLRRRLKHLEASLAELVQEVSAHHEELEKQVTELAAMVAKHNTIIGDKMAACQAAVQELQLMILGEPRYMYPGLAKTVEEQGNLIEEIQNERDALKNQLKGLKVGLGLAGGGSLIGLVAAISELIR